MMISEFFCCRIKSKNTQQLIACNKRNAHSSSEGGNCLSGNLPEIQHRVRIQNRLMIRGDPPAQAFATRDSQFSDEMPRFADDVLRDNFVTPDVVREKH